jgi:hypothetical protein
LAAEKLRLGEARFLARPFATVVPDSRTALIETFKEMAKQGQKALRDDGMPASLRTEAGKAGLRYFRTCTRCFPVYLPETVLAFRGKR